MSSISVIDIGEYTKRYKLDTSMVGIERVHWPPIDIDEPGLLMHGSERDPYGILKFGLIPQKTDKASDEDWQICLGLNAPSEDLKVEQDLSRKNSAIQYSGFFSKTGIVYILSEDVKELPGYREFMESGDSERGYAWLTEPILPDMIDAMITRNVKLVAAAMLAAGEFRPVFKPNGQCYSFTDVRK